MQAWIAHRRLRVRSLRLSLLPVAALALAAAWFPKSATAASGSWSATTSGSWSDAANWLDGTVADGDGFTATFANDITTGVAVSLDAPRTLSGAIFGDADPLTAAAWTLDNGGNVANSLTLTSTSGAVITVSTGATATISADVFGLSNVTRTGGGTLTISGSLTLPTDKQLVFQGGTTNLTGPAVQSQKFNVAGGGVVNWSAGLGSLGTNDYFSVGTATSGTFNMTSGTINYAVTGGFAVNVGNYAPDGGMMTVSGGQFNVSGPSTNLYVACGFTGTHTTVTSGTLTVTGSGVFNFNGGGTIKLTNTSNQTGAIVVSSGGTFRLNGETVTSGSGAASFLIDGGTVQLSASNSAMFAATVGPTIGAAGATIDTNGYPASFGASTRMTGAGTLTKIGSGTLTMRVSSTNFTGKTVIAGGAVSIGVDNQLGVAPATVVDDQLTMLGGAILRTNTSFTLSGRRGITLGSGGGTLSINGGSLTYPGRVTGTGQTMTVTGPSALQISNTTGVATDVNWDFALNSSVRVFYAGSDALGTGSVRIRSGVRLVSQNVAPTGGTVNNAITVDDGGGITARDSAGAVTYTNVTLPTAGSIILNKDDSSQNTAALTISSGVGLTGNLTIDTTQTGSNTIGDVTLSGVFSGTGGLVKSGTGNSGRVILANANTYTGTTTVSSGTLALGSAGSMTNSAAVVVAQTATFDASAVSGGFSLGASQMLTGAGKVVGDVTALGTLATGSGPATLSFANGLSLSTNGDYNWQMLSATGTSGSADAWSLLAVTGTLSIGSTSVDPFTINLWTLSGTSPAVSGSAANFNPAQNYTWRIASAAGGITGFSANKFAINTSATNGTGGFANDLAGGTFSIAQSGNDLNLVFTSGGAPTVITINVPSGTQTQTAAGYPLLSGTTPVVKTGAGTLVLDQANTLTGSTTVQGGVVRLASASALSSSTLAVVAGGTAQVAPYLVAGVGGLNLSGTGLVDVTNGGLTVASGLSPASLVASLVAGRNGGTWDGTSGITSSVTAAQVAASEIRAVGWLDNGDGSLTVAYAAQGDTNLDWVVDILDVANFVGSGKYGTVDPATWAEGDFNYDGIVDIQDVADFAATGLYGGASYNSPSGGASSTAPSGVAAVPEPAMPVLAVLVGGWLLTRARRIRIWR